MSLTERTWQQMDYVERQEWLERAGISPEEAEFAYRSLDFQELPEPITEKLIETCKD